MDVPHIPTGQEVESGNACLPTLLGGRQATSDQQDDGLKEIQPTSAEESDIRSHGSQREVRRNDSCIMHRLSEIQKEMQEATAMRDTQTIQALMAERSMLLEEQQQHRLRTDVPSQEQSVTDEGPLRRLSSRVAGFARQNTRVSVRELIAEGYSRSEANAEVVARNRNEILMEAFEGWICCFTVASICLTVLVTGLLLCHIVAYVDHFRSGAPPCKGMLGPLTNAVLVVALVEMLAWSCNKDKWIEESDPNTAVLHQKHPNHGCLWTFAFSVVVMNIVVLYMLVLHHVQAGSPAEDLPSCQVAAPFLYYASVAHAVGLLVYSGFMVINFIGLSNLLEILMDKGLLKSKIGTLEGAMEHNTIRVTHIDEDDRECPVCLETLTVENSRQTKHCGHTFHTTCLKHWLMVHKTCPLCREDLEFQHPV
mmetsp:Transcript_46704/g.84295  ORF Transcript_46704/g.84295 Transcript_46704/m.84295 type:complete len:423 (-) Transcript_46704:129-1397(-)